MYPGPFGSTLLLKLEMKTLEPDSFRILGPQALAAPRIESSSTGHQGLEGFTNLVTQSVEWYVDNV
jgi:hypothetical protein